MFKWMQSVLGLRDARGTDEIVQRLSSLPSDLIESFWMVVAAGRGFGCA